MASVLARGGAITLAGQAVRIGIQAASLVVLSRLLTPEDFGLFALVTAIVSLGELVRDFGLTPAAIQAPKLSHAQATGIFWLNVGIGGALTLTVVLVTGVITQNAAESALLQVLPVAAIVFLLLGAQSQFQVQLARAHRFAALALSDVVAQACGLAIAVIFALSGAGVWSLVAQLLSVNLTLLILRSLHSRWLPGRPSLEAPIRPLIQFGLNLLGAHALTYLSTRVHTYLISWRWGVAPLGLYDRASTLLNVPVNQLLAPLTNVVLPVLSRLRSEEEEFVDALYSLQVVLCGLATLGFAALLPVAPQILQLLLGEQWVASANLLRILSVGGVFSVLSYISYWAFLATGRTRALFHYNIVSKSLGVLLVFLGSLVSVEAVAAGYSLSLMISWPLNLLWLKKSGGFPFTKFLQGGAGLVLSGALAAGAGWAVVGAMGPSSASTVLSVAASVIVFSGAIVLRPRNRRLLMAGIHYLRKRGR